MESIRAWFSRLSSDPQVVFLILSLVVGMTIVLFFGDIMGPVLASIVIAYLLEGLVGILERLKTPRLLAVSAVILAFVLALLFITLALVPILIRQITQLVQQLPGMIEQGQQLLINLPQRYPNLFTDAQVQALIAEIGEDVNSFRQYVLARTLSFGFGLITMMVYTVLVPVLVFFLLKDKDRILSWFQSYLPSNRGLAVTVWREVDTQMANYIRGKIAEIVIVGFIAFATFRILGLDYAMLLGTLVGFSVLIPYIGAAVATIPVCAVAWFQWGWSVELFYVTLAYGIIQFLDGNILVPLIFSEAVNMHPVAIIIAVLFFGGVWGFWGIFFAIPLATLVQAILKAWPHHIASGVVTDETAP
ncbi:MAG: AI-2E family transporter [Pseudomonadota bacterium]|nr:AI-2E family transporter [Pseudomonadota bacterium]